METRRISFYSRLSFRTYAGCKFTHHGDDLYGIVSSGRADLFAHYFRIRREKLNRFDAYIIICGMYECGTFHLLPIIPPEQFIGDEGVFRDVHALQYFMYARDIPATAIFVTLKGMGYKIKTAETLALAQKYGDAELLNFFEEI